MAYLSNHNLYKFLEVLKNEYNVYVPVKRGEQRFYRRYEEPTEDILIGEVRPFEPLKVFFTRSRERVAEGFKPDVPHAQDKPFAVVGVKACDLKGFKVQDFVFSAPGGSASGGQNHDYADAAYIKNREQNLIIAADCTCAIETCFCLALGLKPYPQEDFDINLSQVDTGFLAEARSQKGVALLKKNASLFGEETEAHRRARDAQRERVIAEVQANIAKNDIPLQDRYEGIIERNYEGRVWADEVKTCVECGACTLICPTCHCFLLYDQMIEQKMARLRTWDSCMFKGYARVAGGANPRPKLWMRLRNRFEKKFDFFPKVAQVYACTGCGRCVSACPAKIDIRKVLRRLVRNE